MGYDAFQHRHNFAVWAAARASQRGFTNVKTLKDALEGCGIVEFVRDCAKGKINDQAFSAAHRTWCNSIIDSLGHAVARKAHFGRAAKLVAVYLKVMIVIPFPRSTLARVAHPPIDRMVLQELSRLDHLEPSIQRRFRQCAWTRLDEATYYELFAMIQTLVPDVVPLWRLERFWKGSDDHAN